MRCVGKALRLEGEPGRLPGAAPAAARDRAIELIPRVELQAALRRADLDKAPALGIAGTRRKPRHLAGSRPEHVIMIVPSAVQQLRIALEDARADCGRFAEVE